MSTIARSGRVGGEVEFNVEQAEIQVLIDCAAQSFEFFLYRSHRRSGNTFVDPEHLVATDFGADFRHTLAYAGCVKSAAGMCDEALIS
jgi:hypothetical protein